MIIERRFGGLAHWAEGGAGVAGIAPAEWEWVMRLDFRIRLTSDVHTIRTHFNNIPDGYKIRSIRQRFGLYRAAET